MQRWCRAWAANLPPKDLWLVTKYKDLDLLLSPRPSSVQGSELVGLQNVDTSHAAFRWYSWMTDRVVDLTALGQGGIEWQSQLLVLDDLTVLQASSDGIICTGTIPVRTRLGSRSIPRPVI
jgi:hypothetical protein